MGCKCGSCERSSCERSDEELKKRLKEALAERDRIGVLDVYAVAAFRELARAQTSEGFDVSSCHTQAFDIAELLVAERARRLARKEVPSG